MNLISKIFLPNPVFAQSDWNSGCYAIHEGDQVATIQGFNCLFGNIAQVIIYFAGLVFFIKFIMGGFKWITSGGDPKKTAVASATLTMSIMGLVGVVLSFLILKFISNFTGINVTEFTIPPSGP